MPANAGAMERASASKDDSRRATQSPPLAVTGRGRDANRSGRHGKIDGAAQTGIAIVGKEVGGIAARRQTGSAQRDIAVYGRHVLPYRRGVQTGCGTGA